ncbi:MAG TPA: c-type cytochrome [Longimicrobiaceae bacterium]|nr:c-type cytochrome [Longimicrobiaceae bacterium]
MREPLRGAAVAFGLLACGAALSACGRAQGSPARGVPGGDVHRGRAAIVAYGCGSCHMIPGIEGADGLVGPPLIHFGSRVYIAGEVTNTPEHLLAWIEAPQAIEPGTAMPNLGVSEAEARDIAAYLYTLR